MSDDRRSEDGFGIDVDARFAEIVSHFHDDEPDSPRVVVVHEVDPVVEVRGTEDTDRPVADGTDGQVAPSHDGSPGGTAPAHQHPEDRHPRQTPADDKHGSEKYDDEKYGEHPSRLGPARFESEAQRRRRIEAEVDAAVDGADGGRFVPPSPPPLPRPDLRTRLAWGAVLLGPALLVVCAFLWDSPPQSLVGAVALAIVVGFGHLVWQLPRNRDDDTDDGAVV